jgi:ribose/xylose/arabinose/galactoside ABC-type transport system permease subunit
MFVMADLASGTTSIGSGWELAVIAGVVVGGVSLFGGVGPWPAVSSAFSFSRRCRAASS